MSQSDIQSNDCFSNLLTKKEKDGNYRIILNLKFLNEECYTQNFAMESIRQAIHML